MNTGLRGQASGQGEGWTKRQPLVYLITNSVNGKRYVGVTRCSLSQRISKHWHAAKEGRPTRIAAAIRKYGREAFAVSILETFGTPEEALAAERRLIAELKPEYNVTLGGEGVLGLHVSAETRAKLSAASRGRPGTFAGRKHTAESLAKMKAAATGRIGPWRGKTRDRAVIEAMRRANIGRPSYWRGKKRSEETRQKISESKKGCAPPSETPLMAKTRRENCRKAARERRRPVHCITTGQRFEGAVEAAAHFGLNGRSVARVCGGDRAQIFGLEFRYEDVA